MGNFYAAAPMGTFMLRTWPPPRDSLTRQASTVSFLPHRRSQVAPPPISPCPTGCDNFRLWKCSPTCFWRHLGQNWQGYKYTFNF